MISAEFRGASLQTTGIGSLPHHNVDTALQFSFQMGMPFLPQIPIRNPWEYMIAQALEEIPGLQAEEDGSVTLNREIWESRAGTLTRRLQEAFNQADSDSQAFQSFEPSTATSSCWQPFVWELEERSIKQAKVQIAGPLTSQWSMRLKDGSSLDRHPEISMQIYRLVLARSIAMVRRLRQVGIKPVIYLDEPGLFGLTSSNAKHALGLQELRLMIQTLRKEGAQVGLHCCSNTDWDAVLNLGLNIISLDTSLSLRTLLQTLEATQEGRADRLAQFVRDGGRLSLGIIPTTRSSVLRTLQPETLFSELISSFAPWREKPELIRQTLMEAIYTPACGLALHSVADAELVLEILEEFAFYARSTLSGGAF